VYVLVGYVDTSIDSIVDVQCSATSSNRLAHDRMTLSDAKHLVATFNAIMVYR
jgi:hypothetical protein